MLWALPDYGLSHNPYAATVKRAFRLIRSRLPRVIPRVRATDKVNIDSLIPIRSIKIRYLLREKGTNTPAFPPVTGYHLFLTWRVFIFDLLTGSGYL